MEKNVIVVDEQGNQIGATYPKRAKGLVKKGRARFVGEDTICLACPPYEFLEDNKMNNNININEIIEDEINRASEPLTSREIFNQLSMLQADKINGSTNSLESLNDTVSLVFDREYQEDEDRVKVVEMLTDAYVNREESVWKIVKLYEKMYDDVSELEKMKAKKDLIQETYFPMLKMIDETESMYEDDKARKISEILDKMTSMIEKIIS